MAAKLALYLMNRGLRLWAAVQPIAGKPRSCNCSVAPLSLQIHHRHEERIP